MLARAFIPSEGIDAQTIYARVSTALLPPGMVGLVMAALFAATMSVLSCGYNVISSVLTIDVYQRLIRPRAPQGELVLVGRILTIGIGATALAIGLSVAHFHWTIFDTMVAAYGLFLPPTVIPMLAGLLSRRLSASGAMAGFIAGVAIGLVFLLLRMRLHPPAYGIFDSLSLIVPAVGTALTLLLCVVWAPATGSSVKTTSDFFTVLETPAVSVNNETPSPAPIAGLIIGLMGLVLVAVGSGFIPECPRNLMPLGVGAVFFAIGLAMMFGPKWLSGRKGSFQSSDQR